MAVLKLYLGFDIVKNREAIFHFNFVYSIMLGSVNSIAFP